MVAKNISVQTYINMIGSTHTDPQPSLFDNSKEMPRNLPSACPPQLDRCPCALVRPKRAHTPAFATFGSRNDVAPVAEHPRIDRMLDQPKTCAHWSPDDQFPKLKDHRNRRSLWQRARSGRSKTMNS